MATTEVILRTKIHNLGAEADVVKVKSGFARNYLVPQGKAYEATEANKQHLEELAAARAKRETEELNQAEKVAAKIKKLKPVFTLETGATGKSFGSVTSMDIHKKLEESGIEIDRHSIKLDKPIKTSGSHEVDIKLHSDLSVFLRLEVQGTEEEA
ncbi:50S ribosomal protein L9 [Roseibacillus persicicus]|uniref:Large ribosomal subunit protein bL9 n=1 Tax=Roseibacillus persicicus TaxID=454148 RepID=A0A918TM01_9BACT|nr:50S ribosomal protein L9 [Roseibacillus persicicus]MDQ8191648.1 50S ribosomal protein L9 [Roseibacillus persicicus]GHC51849.1 50S ribosomal protein L9 [Roseibacillus persicicus]